MLQLSRHMHQTLLVDITNSSPAISQPFDHTSPQNSCISDEPPAVVIRNKWEHSCDCLKETVPGTGDLCEMQIEESANAVPILLGLSRCEEMHLFREVLRVVHHGEPVLFVPLSAPWCKEMRRCEVVYGVWCAAATGGE